MWLKDNFKLSATFYYEKVDGYHLLSVKYIKY